jgi:hypothetical protein
LLSLSPDSSVPSPLSLSPLYSLTAQREHAEQLEKETLTFRPSLVTSPRVRSPSPQRDRGSGERGTKTRTIDVMSPEGEGQEGEGESNTTPLRHLYNLGSRDGDSDGEGEGAEAEEGPRSGSPQRSPHKDAPLPFYER